MKIPGGVAWNVPPLAGPTIGILGGMGPAATVDFYEKIVRLTPATSDQQHLRVVIWADPSTPDRSEALLHAGPDPTPWLVHGVRTLTAAGADVIVVPCNTAHAFLEPIGQAAGDVPVMDLIKYTCLRIQDLDPALRYVGLLATTGTTTARLYHSPLERLGIDVIAPDEQTQTREVMGAIHAIKAAQDATVLVEKLAGDLVARGAQAVIAGCTEIAMALGASRLPVPVVDPAQILARATVAWALDEKARHAVDTPRGKDALRIVTTTA